MDGDFHAWAMLSTCYRATGDNDKLREAAKKMVSEAQAAVQQDPSNGAALGILAGGYALLGEKEKTQEWIERALLVDPENVTMRYNFACILAGYVGDTEGALKMLQSSFAIAGEYQVRIAEIDTDLDRCAMIRVFRRCCRRPSSATGSRRRRAYFTPFSLENLDRRIEHLAFHRAFALRRGNRRVEDLLARHPCLR